MKKSKKISVIFSGAILVILGFYAGGFFSLLNHPAPLMAFWYFLLFLSGPLCIVSGIGLFFFKKWAWKLAVFSYKILLLHAIYYNIFIYAFAIGYVGRSKPHLFSIKNIIYYFQYAGPLLVPLLLILIPIFFIVLLNSSKEEFGIETAKINNMGFRKRLISGIKNNAVFFTIIILILIFGTVFVKYANKRLMIRQVCKGKCNTGPIPGPLVNVDKTCYKKCVEDGYSQISHFEDWMHKMHVHY